MKIPSKMPRSVGIFVLAWLIVLLLPPLRRQRWGVWKPQASQIFQVSPIQNLWDPASDVLEYPQTPEFRCQAALDESQMPTHSAAGALNPLFPLVRQNPQFNWLRAGLLRNSTRGSIRMEVYAPEWHQGNRPAWLQPDLMKRCLLVAREAETQEPGNAFFPIMQAVYLFSLKNEQPGWQALARASKCTHYNDYTVDASLRRIRMHKNSAALQWEERWAIRAAILFPHYAPMYSLTRVACLRAHQALTAGNRNLAISRYEAALAIGRSLRKENRIYLTQSVGEGIEHLVWQEAALAQGKKIPDIQWDAPYEEKFKNTQEAVNAYTTFVLDAHHPAEATATQDDFGSFISRRLHDQMDIFVPAASPRNIRLAAQGYWLSGWLARFAWIAALIWFVLLATKRAPWLTLSRGAITGSTLFVSVALTVLTIGCLQRNAGGTIALWNTTIYESDINNIQTVEHSFLYLVAGLWVLPILLWWFAGYCRLFRAHRPTRSIVVARLRHPKLIQVIQAVVWLVGLSYGYASYVFGPEGFEDTWTAWPLPLIITASCLLPAIILALWDFWHLKPLRFFPSVRDTARHTVTALALLGAVSGRLAFVLTLAYMMATVAIWPVRIFLYNQTLKTEQRGEIPVRLEWLNQQSAQENTNRATNR